MNRKDLVEKLELASRALADTNLIPIMQCFAFDKKTVTACNDTIAIILPCETKQSFCVNGKVLLGLLSHSMAQEVDFATDGLELLVQAGRSQWKLPWFPISDYLFKPTRGASTWFMKMTSKSFRGMGACLLTSSKDLAQPALMGVCVALDTFYSTDGDAITRSGDAVPAKAKRAMLPNSFCETIVKANLGCKLVIGEDWVTAQEFVNGMFVYGRLLQVDNPIDYEMWIAKTLKLPEAIQWKSIPDGLDNALLRARVVADPESAKTVITTSKGTLELLTETHMGTIHDSLKWPATGDVKATVSAELIQRCASMCDEMAVFPNCCCFRSGDDLFILTSNMG